MDDFRMVVDDRFFIIGRGTVVTGNVESGTLKKGETVLINGSRSCLVTAIEAFRKMPDSAKAGDNVGLVLAGVTKDEVRRGDVITKA